MYSRRHELLGRTRDRANRIANFLARFILLVYIVLRVSIFVRLGNGLSVKGDQRLTTTHSPQRKRSATTTG